MSKKKKADEADEELDYEDFEGKETDGKEEKSSEEAGGDDGMTGLEVTDLPGVGPAIGKRLAENGYKSVEAILLVLNRL